MTTKLAVDAIGLAATDPADNSVIKWGKYHTVTSGAFYGINGGTGGVKTTAGAFTGYLIGSVAHAALGAANTQNWSGDGVHVPLVAMWAQVDTESLSAGTVSESACINAIRTFAGSSVVTTSSGLRIGTPTINGVVQNLYGILIKNQTGGTVSNWAIYVEGGESVFQGITAQGLITGVTATFDTTNTNGVVTTLSTRNQSTGTGAVNRTRFGNSTSVSALTIDVYGGGYTGTPNFVSIMNQNNADFILGTNGNEAIRLLAAGGAKITGDITTSSTTLHKTSVALGNGAAAAAGTLTNAPAAGNPTKWIPINDNGTTRYIPAW